MHIVEDVIRKYQTIKFISHSFSVNRCVLSIGHYNVIRILLMKKNIGQTFTDKPMHTKRGGYFMVTALASEKGYLIIRFPIIPVRK